MKKQNGITLIALVITIIVLLILAGVSISLVLGENGVLDKAKNERTENEEANTQYNVLNKINLSNSYKPPDIDDEELKNMIEAIENNKSDYTMDLLDDLKTIHDANMKEEIIELEDLDKTIDKSFYTTGINFTDEDFEQIKDGIKRNNNLTKVLIIILSIVILLGLGFIIFYII